MRWGQPFAVTGSGVNRPRHKLARISALRGDCTPPPALLPLRHGTRSRRIQPGPAPAANDQSALKAEVAAVIGELDRLIAEAKNG
jgi:hypothetical protein